MAFRQVRAESSHRDSSQRSQHRDGREYRTRDQSQDRQGAGLDDPTQRAGASEEGNQMKTDVRRKTREQSVTTEEPKESVSVFAFFAVCGSDEAEDLR